MTQTAEWDKDGVLGDVEGTLWPDESSAANFSLEDSEAESTAALVLAALRSKSVGETHEVSFVDCAHYRDCGRNVFCRRRFPLARSLFSISSAATEVALFGDFLDTMDLSASNALRLRLPMSVHLRGTPLGFSKRLAAPTATSRHGTSRFSCKKVLYMLRAFASPWRYAVRVESDQHLR